MKHWADKLDANIMHGTTNPISEIPEVGVQLREWQVTLVVYLYNVDSMYSCGEMAAHATVSPNTR